MDTLDPNNARQLLDHLCKSKLFSDTEKKLLQYLVEAHFDNSTDAPKETTIAIDIFGKTAEFNPAQDSIVRSYIYNLRKKLVEYYLTEGKHDQIQLHIPKGHYQIEFTKNSHHGIPGFFADKNKIFLVSLVIVFAGLSAILLLHNLSLNSGNTMSTVSPQQQLLWGDFVQSGMPTLIVFGDYFFYQEIRPDAPVDRYVRNGDINSVQDLAAFLQIHPEYQSVSSGTPATFLGKEVPEAMSMLLQEFQPLHIQPKIALASELNWRDLKENNIIFIGHYQTLRSLNSYFNHLRYKAGSSPRTIYYTPTYRDTVDAIALSSSEEDDLSHDYAVVAKFPGGNGNSILLICSFYSFGKVEATELLTSPEKLNAAFTGIDGGLPPYFELLLQIYGAGNMGFQSEILDFDPIDPGAFNQAMLSGGTGGRENR